MPPRPARTAQPSRSRSHPPPRPRWDRIGTLLAGLVILVWAVVHTIGDLRDAASAEPEPPHPQPVEAAACRPAAMPIRVAPGAADQRTVALTFDDGPGRWTPQVLKILHDRRVTATFFVIGTEVRRNPGRLLQIRAAGHVIGNHSWDHPVVSPTKGWQRAALKSEIDRTTAAIQRVTGARPCLFRPPGGVVKGTTGIGLSVALWSVDTKDWRGQQHSDRTQTARIRAAARVGLGTPHPVVLLHDGGGYRGNTLAALPGIIDDYRAAGYRFVPLSG